MLINNSILIVFNNALTCLTPVPVPQGEMCPYHLFQLGSILNSQYFFKFRRGFVCLRWFLRALLGHKRQIQQWHVEASGSKVKSKSYKARQIDSFNSNWFIQWTWNTAVSEIIMTKWNPISKNYIIIAATVKDSLDDYKINMVTNKALRSLKYQWYQYSLNDLQVMNKFAKYYYGDYFKTDVSAVTSSWAFESASIGSSRAQRSNISCTLELLCIKSK
jgi:hypothetical protein